MFMFSMTAIQLLRALIARAALQPPHHRKPQTRKHIINASELTVAVKLKIDFKLLPAKRIDSLSNELNE